MKWKIINTILRIIALPFVFAIILIKYNAHAIVNVACFLIYGGEWITYAKDDRATIQYIYRELKHQPAPAGSGDEKE